MFENSIRVGRIFGIEISIDVSWLFIAFLVGWSFYVQFSAVVPDLGTGQALALAVVSTLVFFLSVLLHEVSHSLVARGLGIPVGGITLFLFGGVTRTRLESERPGHEFWVAVVGPLTSFAIAAVLWGVAALVDLPRAIEYSVVYLAFLNLILAVFNLLPGFPLDGGRVLRSAVWAATGSLSRATRVAAAGGRILGGLLIAFGLFQVFLGNLGGLWLAAIGWFLFQAAAASSQDVVIRRLLRDVDASDLMSAPPVTIPVRMTVDQAVREAFFRHDHSAFPVVRDGAAVGMLTMRRVKELPRDAWDTTSVEEAMVPLGELCVVPPGRPMDSVLDDLRADETDRVLVVDGREVVGIITPRDVARWVRRVQELGLPSDRPLASPRA